jgi:hypothetical protein
METMIFRKTLIGSVAVAVLLGVSVMGAGARESSHSCRVMMPLCGVSRVSAPAVGLAVNRRKAKAGGAVQVRIENRGKQEVAYGYDYELARFENGFWLRLETKPVFDPRFFLVPGAKGPWQRIQIPRDAVPGRYRIRKWVERVGPPNPPKFPIKAEFHVVD